MKQNWLVCKHYFISNCYHMFILAFIIIIIVKKGQQCKARKE